MYTVQSSNAAPQLLEHVSCIFAINGEMVKGYGEDSFAFSINNSYGLIGVFDGCGGIGSRKYERYGKRSGAYIASHTVSTVALRWFKELSAKGIVLSKNNENELCESLKKLITENLVKLNEGADASMVKGRLSKSFPTTAAMVAFSKDEARLHASFIWAGDSRGFILTRKGLCQITADDIDADVDAMENLYTDSKLSNVISAEGDYVLNSRTVLCGEPSVFITATDGYFAYFTTPMEFEYMLIETLSNASSVNEWKSNLTEHIKQYTGDDYTMAVAACGFETFNDLKKHFIERRKKMKKDYISKLPSATDEQKKLLWEEYKVSYYRGS